MKNNIRFNYAIFALIFLANILAFNSYTQNGVSINTSGTAPDASAILDLSAQADKGFILPKVALTGVNAAAPLTLPATGILVWNTATVGPLTPGLYYNSGTAAAPVWTRLATGASTVDWTSDGNTNGAIKYIGTNDNFDFPIRTNSAERMRIMTAGNVGIGTVAPDASAILDLTSTSRGFLLPRVALTATNLAGPVAAPVAGLMVYNTAIAGVAPNNVTPGQYYWDGAKWVRYATGNVGWEITGNLGTTAPTSAIGVAINNNFIGTTDLKDFVLATNNLERMRISGSGNVGLGTLTPRGIFDVQTNGDIYLASDPNVGTSQSLLMPGNVLITPFNATNVANLNAKRANNTGTVALQINTYNAGANVNAIRVEGDGDVGIGTTAPTNKLTIIANSAQGVGIYSGNALNTFLTIGRNFAGEMTLGIPDAPNNFLNGTVAGDGVLRIDDPTKKLVFGAGVGINPTMVIATSNIGVGTTAPNASALLDLTSTSRGLLVPRVALTATNAAGPVTAPATSLMVYNTATAGIAPNNVTPGYYYWDGAAWLRFDTGNTLGPWLLDGNNNGVIRNIGTNDNFDLPIETNGTEKMRVTTGGNVGIGIVAPQARLDITGSTASTNSLLVRSGNDLNTFLSNQILFGWNGTNTYQHAIKTRHNSTNTIGNSYDFYLWSQGVDAAGTIGTRPVMTIDGNYRGMVGIGTTAPKSELHITDGSASLKAVTDAGGYGASVLITDNVIPRIYFESAGLPANKKLMGITSLNQVLSIGSLNDIGSAWDQQFILSAHRDGFVGINMGNPIYNLEVNGSFGFGNGTAGTYRSRTETRNDAGLMGNGAQSGMFETSAPAPAADWPVGANSWWHLLDVRHSNNGNNYAMQFSGSFFDQELYFRKTNGAGNTAWSRVLTTSSLNTLAWSLAGNGGTNAATNFIGTTDPTDLVFRTSNTEKMRVMAGGNVGIGIVAPLQKLDVQGGNARINNAFIGDVGHGATWAGYSHYSQATTTGYSLLASNDGNYTFINKLNTGVGYIGFRMSNADVAVINGAGNMGIGTTGPAANARLHVVGGAIMPQTGNNISSGIYFTPNAGGGGGDEAYIRHYVEAGENTKMVIANLNDNDDDISIRTGLVAGGYDRLNIGGLGTINMARSVIFDCNDCGSTTAYDLTDGTGGNYGDLVIQGRVLSTNSNLHLSPPGGSKVIINSTYRAAGGGGGTTGLDIEDGGIRMRKNYRYFQRYGYTTSGNGWDNSQTHNLGAWDFCAVAQVGFKNNASTTDEDDDVQCAVYPNGGFIGEQQNDDWYFTEQFNTRHTWSMYFEAFEDTNGITCAATCWNLE